MVPKSIAQSDYQDTNTTGGKKFTGRFKHAETDIEDSATEENDTLKEESKRASVQGANVQLDPLEVIQKAHWESNIKLNNSKAALYKFIQVIAIPIIIGVVSVILVVWQYNISQLSVPIKVIESNVMDLKEKDVTLEAAMQSKDSALESKIQIQDTRLYDFLNGKNNPIKK